MKSHAHTHHLHWPLHHNHDLVLGQIAGLNFLTFAIRGLTVPFISLYLISVGFSGTEIGLLVGASALVRIVITPILHTLADHRGWHRRLFYGLQIGNILGAVGLVLSTNKFCLSGANILRESASLPGVSLLAQLTITWLDEHNLSIYGRIRARGSFGWSVTTFISGGIIAIGGYPLLFILAALSNLFMLPLAKVLPESTNGRPVPDSQTAPRPRVFYFILLSIGLFYTGTNVMSAFGYIYFKHNLGATDAMIGMLASVTALAEIPSMILYERMLKHANFRSLLVVGMLGQAAFWLALSLLTGSTFLLPLMLSRGTFYTFQNVSMTLLVSRISHPTNVATNQSLAQVTAPGLAVLLTGPLSGWIFDHLGPRVLFQLVTLMGIGAALLLLAAWRHLAARESHVRNLPERQAAG